VSEYSRGTGDQRRLCSKNRSATADPSAAPRRAPGPPPELFDRPTLWPSDSRSTSAKAWARWPSSRTSPADAANSAILSKARSSTRCRRGRRGPRAPVAASLGPPRGRQFGRDIEPGGPSGPGPRSSVGQGAAGGARNEPAAKPPDPRRVGRRGPGQPEPRSSSDPYFVPQGPDQRITIRRLFESA